MLKYLELIKRISSMYRCKKVRAFRLQVSDFVALVMIIAKTHATMSNTMIISQQY